MMENAKQRVDAGNTVPHGKSLIAVGPASECQDTHPRSALTCTARECLRLQTLKMYVCMAAVTDDGMLLHLFRDSPTSI